MAQPVNPSVFLRRTFTPYVGGIVILASVHAFCIFVAFKQRSWEFIWVPFWVWGIFGVYVLDATRYRVSWNETGVTMYWDLGKRTIPFENITNIHYETASLSDGHYGTRPFRRIVIRGSRSDPKAFVDVSLRHFEPEDIDALLQEIHRCWPELTIPWQAVRGYLSIDSPDGSSTKTTLRSRKRKKTDHIP
jgi:hypothetical protein